MKPNLKDKIRGCLIAGAAGDAIGYAVEFICHNAIIERYGTNGITKFELKNGKALVSDDTQMTLFTANGLLNAHKSGVSPKEAITNAYIDWYYTQMGGTNERKSCRISDIDELNHRRAPGNTCLTALYSIIQGQEVINNSKGCGGIMRVAPIPLYTLATNSADINSTALLAGDAAEITHKHPLGFMPAALLAALIYKVAPMETEMVKRNIGRIIADTLEILDIIYKDGLQAEKQRLKELTERAIELAHSDTKDVAAISKLGEGWIAEETWAIAIYCVVRHIGNIEQAIAASVNHNGDSDSTGAVCGNIIGAIYGYERIKEANIFCNDSTLENTLELSGTILSLADELADKGQQPHKTFWQRLFNRLKKD